MQTSYLVVDIGNTHLKFAFFEANEICMKGIGLENLQLELQTRPYSYSIIASVGNKEITNQVMSLLENPIIAHNQLKLPITLDYDTPHTLGVDRLANAIAIHTLAKGKPALAVDAGTCLKFDFVNQEGIYMGGSIGPGLHMRFKAMHAFTANLPLIETWSKKELIGKSTKGSMVSGALIGMEHEIKTTIQRYQSQYKDLMIFMTGGDLKYFDLELKNPIFALENLTLLGLKLILEENV